MNINNPLDGPRCKVIVVQYVSKKVSDLSIFFLDTPWIRIQDISNEYRYRIGIQVSDTLWVEVSGFYLGFVFLSAMIQVNLIKIWNVT
jgi:hypothetical protein